MNKTIEIRKEAIALLKLNIEFGVDEALSKTTRNRFTEKSLKDHLEAETHQEELEHQLDASVKKDEIEKDILHKGTVRSGDRISSNGDLFIMGDVNPGAIVSANNNVYVWGKLLGIAFAGKYGNGNA